MPEFSNKTDFKNHIESNIGLKANGPASVTPLIQARAVAEVFDSFFNRAQMRVPGGSELHWKNVTSAPDFALSGQNGDILYVAPTNPNSSDSYTYPEAVGESSKPFKTLNAAFDQCQTNTQIFIFGAGEDFLLNPIIPVSSLAITLFGYIGSLTINSVIAANNEIYISGVNAYVENIRLSEPNNGRIKASSLKIKNYNIGFRGKITLDNCDIENINTDATGAVQQFVFSDCIIRKRFSLRTDNNTYSSIMTAKNTVFKGGVNSLLKGFTAINCEFGGGLFFRIVNAGGGAASLLLQQCIVKVPGQDFIIIGNTSSFAIEVYLIDCFVNLGTSSNPTKKIITGTGNIDYLFQGVVTDVAAPHAESGNALKQDITVISTAKMNKIASTL